MPISTTIRNLAILVMFVAATGCDESSKTSEEAPAAEPVVAEGEQAAASGAEKTGDVPAKAPMSASGKFQEAVDLASQEKFNEAIEAFNEVQIGWPDSPEARLMPKKRHETYLAHSRSILASGDVLNAAASVDHYMTAEGIERDFGKRIDIIGKFTGGDQGLMVAWPLAPFGHGLKAGELTPLRMFEQHLKIIGDMDVTKPVAQYYGELICADITKNPEWAICLLPAPNPEGSPLSDLKAHVEKVGQSCVAVAGAKPLCGAQLVAPALQALGTAQAVREGWIQRSQQDAAKARKKLAKLGKKIKKMVKQHGKATDKYTHAIALGSPSQQRRALSKALTIGERWEKKTEKVREQCRAAGAVADADWPEDLAREIRSLVYEHCDD